MLSKGTSHVSNPEEEKKTRENEKKVRQPPEENCYLGKKDGECMGSAVVKSLGQEKGWDPHEKTEMNGQKIQLEGDHPCRKIMRLKRKINKSVGANLNRDFNG